MGIAFEKAKAALNPGGISQPISRFLRLAPNWASIEGIQIVAVYLRCRSAGSSPSLLQPKIRMILIVQGVFFLRNTADDKPQFVFKAGAKRATFRKPLQDIGLDDGIIAQHVVTVVPCVLQNTPLDTRNTENESELMIPLWNGKHASYVKNPRLVVVRFRKPCQIRDVLKWRLPKSPCWL